MSYEELIPTDEGATMATRAIVGSNLADPNVIYTEDYLPADVLSEYKPLQPAGDASSEYIDSSGYAPVYPHTQVAFINTAL